MSNTVTELHFLLNILSSFTRSSLPFCHVAPLCMVSSSQDPWPYKEKLLLGHHITASRTAGEGHRLLPSKAEMPQPELLTGVCPHPAGSAGLLQPRSCKAAPLREAIHGAKVSGWGTLPACGSSLGNAEAQTSRRLQWSEEPLRTPGYKSGHCRLHPPYRS